MFNVISLVLSMARDEKSGDISRKLTKEVSYRSSSLNNRWVKLA
jgi:hypothetical protein